jgi:hypothetical protein
MKLFLRSLFACIAFIILIFAASRLSRIRSWILTNNAVYHAMQGNWAAADAQLNRVSQSGGLSNRGTMLLARSKMAFRDFAAARQVLKHSALPVDALFDLAVCEYELGNNKQARELFSRYYAKSVQLLNSQPELIAISESASSGFLSQPDVDPVQIAASDYPVLPLLYESFSGRSAFRLHHYRSAATHLDKAFELNDANPELPIIAAAANAAAGNFSKAQFYADTSDNGYTRIESLLQLETREMTSRTLTAEESGSVAESQFALIRALSWVNFKARHDKHKASAFDLQQIADLLTIAPFDLKTNLLYADALADEGLLREAYLHLSVIQERQWCFAANLRQRWLSGMRNVPPFTPAEGADLPRIQIAAKDLATTDAVSRGDYLAFFSRSSARASFEIPNSDQYEITLAARGDRAFGLWPLVRIRMDDAVIGMIYVNREGWDLFSISAVLEKGTHTMNIEYVNNSVRLLSRAEDRNLYVSRIFVSKAGVFH